MSVAVLGATPQIGFSDHSQHQEAVSHSVGTRVIHNVSEIPKPPPNAGQAIAPRTPAVVTAEALVSKQVIYPAKRLPTGK